MQFEFEGFGVSPPSNAFVVDHVIPRASGGSDDQLNLVAACWRCNSSKRIKTLEEFRLMWLRKAGAFFTNEQISFWESRGVNLPVFPAGEYPKFYGEKL